MTTKEIKWTPIDKCGSMIPVKNFIAMCECGALIDYDGIGYYAEKDKVSDIMIKPSDVVYGISEEYSYILWFNR